MAKILLFIGGIVLFLSFFLLNQGLFFVGDEASPPATTTAEVVSVVQQDATQNNTEKIPLKSTAPVAAVVEKITAPLSPQTSVSAPKVAAPLVHYGSKASDNSLLSSEVIAWTNTYRAENNLNALRRNTQLDSAAIIKVHDMFNLQYFEHVSPSGKNSADLVSGVGYDYLWVGENLALGIFSSEKDLVDAWMASPGHRANILSSHFEEIGVGVEEGEYEGKHVWIAVQEFGKPSSSCPAPETSLKTEIETNRQKIDILTGEANALIAEMNALNKKNETEAYNQKVAEYNAVVSELNPLVKNTKVLIDIYNKEISEYNACIET